MEKVCEILDSNKQKSYLVDKYKQKQNIINWWCPLINEFTGRQNGELAKPMVLDLINFWGIYVVYKNDVSLKKIYHIKEA